MKTVYIVGVTKEIHNNIFETYHLALQASPRQLCWLQALENQRKDICSRSFGVSEVTPITFDSNNLGSFSFSTGGWDDRTVTWRMWEIQVFDTLEGSRFEFKKPPIDEFFIKKVL